MDLIYFLASVIIFLFELLLFVGLYYLSKYIYRKIKADSNNKLFNMQEYLPEEEIHTLKQVFYLMIITLCFVNIVYSMLFWYDDLSFFALFDILLSLFCCLTLKKEGYINKIIFVLLIPFASMIYIATAIQTTALLYIIHIPMFLIIIKRYYSKFIEYTESNGLGIAILLLFFIVFVSFISTSITENVNLLDSLNMVSNAFTSNGYTILGKSIIGKINAIVLVWSGYILSGVGTATLTSAILIRHFNHRFDELKELIEKNND